MTTQTKNTQDVIGQALLDYQQHGQAPDIQVHCPDFEDDVIPVQHFFRSFSDMPSLEQQALSQCKGHVLDIGAGAGSHALYLQSQGHAVTALDISPGAVSVQKARGIQHALCADIHAPETQAQLANTGFDTILLLMNGIGLAGTLSGLTQLLGDAKRWLKPEGIILLDSSDLIYLHEEEDGAVALCLTDQYYGELSYEMSYKTMKTSRFPWLFVDFDNLSDKAQAQGFSCELLYQGEHYDYLAKLSLLADTSHHV